MFCCLIVLFCYTELALFIVCFGVVLMRKYLFLTIFLIFSLDDYSSDSGESSAALSASDIYRIHELEKKSDLSRVLDFAGESFYRGVGFVRYAIGRCLWRGCCCRRRGHKGLLRQGICSLAIIPEVASEDETDLEDDMEKDE